MNESADREFEYNRLLKFQSQIVVVLHDACESGDLTAAKQLLSQISDPEKAMQFRNCRISELEIEIERLQSLLSESCRLLPNRPCFCGSHISEVK